MNDFEASSVLWRRLIYMLTPQIDIYESIRKIVQGRRVLEIGFGTGLGVLQYYNQAEYVDAVEIDEAAVSFARKMMPLQNVRWLQDDISNPTRTYRGYDLFIMIEVLEHITDRARTLEIIRDSLRLGGSGILTVPNSNRYRRRIEPGNHAEWTPTSILADAGQVFSRVVCLDTALMPQEDLDHKESPVVIGVYRARD